MALCQLRAFGIIHAGDGCSNRGIALKGPFENAGPQRHVRESQCEALNAGVNLRPSGDPPY